MFWIIIIAGFKSKGFGSIFHNKYSIEVHPRTNAIGLPITIDNLLDDTEIPIDTTFPYDTFIQAVYDPDDWNSSFTSNSGIFNSL